MSKSSVIWSAAGFGIIAGMRSGSAPALLSNHFCKHKNNALRGSKWKWFCSKPASNIFSVMAAGEVLADKMPSIPDRISPPGLAGRAVSGALAGMVLDKATKGRTPVAPLVGAGAAIAAAFASFYGRKALSRKIADRKIAVVEDLIVYGIGAWLTRTVSR
jgi:uncharacterized membrane protein